MDDQLLTVARTLAQRGWLPGIRAKDLDFNRGVVTYFDPIVNDYTLAEPFLHLAAHNEFCRRKWQYDVMPDTDEIVIKGVTAIDGTTTLSLLRALLRACEESEASKEKT